MYLGDGLCGISIGSQTEQVRKMLRQGISRISGLILMLREVCVASARKGILLLKFYFEDATKQVSESETTVC
jgi:hypothetical protein